MFNHDELKKRSPDYRRFLRLPKSTLIWEVSKQLWIHTGKKGSIPTRAVTHAKLTNIDLSLLLWDAEYSDGSDLIARFETEKGNEK